MAGAGKTFLTEVSEEKTEDNIFSPLVDGRMDKISPDKRWPLSSGLLAVSINSTLVGFICNSYLRRMCKLRGKGVILGMVPIAGGCALTMQAIWQSTVVVPLLKGNLKCPLCAELRGSLVNFTFGALYPLVLAVPINGALAAMYKTIEVPKLSSKTSSARFAEFWVRKLRYFKVQFVTLAIFQALVGGYLAKKQFETIVLLNEMDSGDTEASSVVT